MNSILGYVPPMIYINYPDKSYVRLEYCPSFMAEQVVKTGFESSCV